MAGGSILKNDTPQILVFAGPNGSGKSTITQAFDVIGKYINADDIKKFENCNDMEAALIATQLREYCLSNRESFTFETVLSSDRNVDLLKRAKKSGYKIYLIFVLTKDVNININRVRERVKKGGHDVPEEKIRSRYSKSLSNLSKLFKIADIIKVVDNSLDVPHMIIEVENKHVVLHETKLWSIKEIQNLINNNFNKKDK